MRVTMILPALTEATSPLFRPIKYSLFPPLGLATLAGYLDPDDEVTLHDEHVERIDLDALDTPDLLVIQPYITSARRSYEIADVPEGLPRRRPRPAATTPPSAPSPDCRRYADLLERAVEAGLRSPFVGFETVNDANLAERRKDQNIGTDYAAAVRRLHDAGVMVNASFVFGLDQDGPDVFDRTVAWAVEQGIETATFHIMTPYPSTGLWRQLESENRIVHRDWDLYDTDPLPALERTLAAFGGRE
ncbi:hypothetical protein AB0H97_04980 [Streptomyces sp. NPDC050788]|jgi:hypothetical protein|uniref:hypothetical protein n=1 Tax=Streptomyces sp. NPDC050788 TaxID=3155041 RepID=UPI00341D36E9